MSESCIHVVDVDGNHQHIVCESLQREITDDQILEDLRLRFNFTSSADPIEVL